jgi:hypothetical protein
MAPTAAAARPPLRKVRRLAVLGDETFMVIHSL